MKALLLCAVFALSGFMASSCQEDQLEPGGASLNGPSPADVDPFTATGDGLGRLRIILHDAPVDEVEEVWVEFDEVSVHHDEIGWLTISEEVQVVELLSLRDGVVAELGLVELPVGVYSQIRLHLTDAWVVRDGTEENLEVPSGFESGLKLVHTFEVPECGELVVSLDWDVGAHLHHNAGQGFILRPVILVEHSIDDTGCHEWIVFARENDVWRVRPDGSDVARIVDQPEGAQVLGIVLSPDASRVAYLEYYGEFSTANRLMLVNIDGSDPRTVVNTGGNGGSGVCDFHPDGNHVMYFRDVSPGGGQNYEIYEASIDGTSDLNLTNHANNEGCGSYSPTGDQITFASGTPFQSAAGDIYTQNHDGTGRTNIFDLGGDSDNTPKWSPDGERILISSRYTGDQEDLYLIDPDGTDPVQLTSTPGVRERHKAWSPDGTRIVFERIGNLYLIDRDGSDEVLFLESATYPDWAGVVP